MFGIKEGTIISKQSAKIIEKNLVMEKDYLCLWKKFFLPDD